MSAIDVSVILNMHREALYIEPTLRSLQRCANVARANGISVELIAVFDRSDAHTRDVFRSADLSGFDRTETVDVDLGSLGLARNAGVELARGEYIWTADADDLLSSNCIVELLARARAHPHGKVAVFMEYLCAFGDQYHNVRYVGSEYLTAADFAFQHPYGSRVFLNRSAFEVVKYDDLRVTSGFAYEDWFFNCELRAHGYDMVVAPDTVMFYRQRPGSLLRQADAASVRLIPHSRLFDIGPFLAEMKMARNHVGNWDDFMRVRRSIFDTNNTELIMRSDKLVNFIREAVELEPEIEPNRIETAVSYTPIPWDPRHWGMHLENLYRMLGQERFTDVILVPWLKPGGAEKYILQILGEISAKEPAARILVVAGEAASRHDWAAELSKSTVFVDIYNAFPSLSDANRDAMLLRAMLASAEQGARLHVKSSVFAHRLFEAYAPVLASRFKTIYYRFSDGIYLWRGKALRGPWAINWMRRHLSKFWKVVNDCDAIAKSDARYLGPLQGRYETIYARCEPHESPRADAAPTGRLLWASRVAVEKRPELVAKIVDGVRAAGIDLVVEAYGRPDPDMMPSELFASDAIRYRGAFSSFSELPVEHFDAFVYTSAYDGLPNILLEALSAGLPVIAPDVGGIREAVIDGVTGWLVQGDDDEAVVQGYVTAIVAMYRDWPASREMASNGIRLIEQQHGADTFSKRVAEAFRLGNSVVQKVA